MDEIQVQPQTGDATGPSAPPAASFAAPPPYAPPPRAGMTPAAREFLLMSDFPPGLCALIEESTRDFALRFFVVDNSGSMSHPDGRCLRTSAKGEKMVQCSRWEEVGDLVQFHGTLAAALGAPTEFRLLNPPRGGRQTVTVRGEDDLEDLRKCMASGPSGSTPLCEHVVAVVSAVEAELPALRAAQRQAVLVIVTDGVPTDGDLRQAMRPLARLPVWVVVRLCTDDENVISFWSELDADVECDMDVLDDLEGEAAEVAPNAPWLTYGPALHRLREWGSHQRILDLLDERPLAPAEVRDLARLILGGSELPHPDVDPADLVAEVSRRQVGVRAPYNPTKGRRTPWVDERRLAAAVRKGGCAVS